ncbi:MAG: peptidoglycan-binding domain-containing protein [bacterium]|nr:peptidoglycan-binding domain-containing protein [bacterium]
MKKFTKITTLVLIFSFVILAIAAIASATTGEQLPNIVLTKTALYDAGTQKVTYTIDWGVSGGNVDNLTITDTLPAWTDLVVGSVVPPTTPPLANGSRNFHPLNPTQDRDIVWDLGPQGDGTEGTIAFQVEIWAKKTCIISKNKVHAEALLSDQSSVSANAFSDAINVEDEHCACNANAQKVVVSDVKTIDEDGPAVPLTFIHPAWTANIPGATWIWATDPVESPTNDVDLTKTFTRTFIILGAPTSGTLDVAADNHYTAKVNGNTVPVVFDENNFELATQDSYDVSTFLLGGLNTIEIKVTNQEVGQDPDPVNNPAGLLYKLTVNNNECIPPPLPIPAHLIVEKTTYPSGDPTSFPITATGNGTITGGGSGTVTDAVNKDYEVTPGTYSVTEDLSNLPLWREDSNTCSSVVLNAGETKTCTIVNKKAAQIQVIKTTLGDIGTFDFIGNWGGNLSITTLAEDIPVDSFFDVFVNVAGEPLSVTETVPSGWIVDNATCNLATVMPGSTTNTCSFTNTKQLEDIGGNLPQCSDNVDNEDTEDTLIDEEDPGCYPNNNPESGTYDPNDNDESNSTPQTNGSGSGGGGGSSSGSRRVSTYRAPGEVLGAEASCGIYVDKFLRKGYRNNVEAVKLVQRFLNDYTHAVLVVDGVFGQKMEGVLKAFQLAHSDKILAPWGITVPTGIFYLTTQIEVNNIMCPTLNLPIPSNLVNFTPNVIQQ